MLNYPRSSVPKRKNINILLDIGSNKFKLDRSKSPSKLESADTRPFHAQQKLIESAIIMPESSTKQLRGFRNIHRLRNSPQPKTPQKQLVNTLSIANTGTLYSTPPSKIKNPFQNTPQTQTSVSRKKQLTHTKKCVDISIKNEGKNPSSLLTQMINDLLQEKRNQQSRRHRHPQPETMNQKPGKYNKQSKAKLNVNKTSLNIQRIDNIHATITHTALDYMNMDSISSLHWQYYQGEVQDGQRHGYGTLYFTNNEKYTGVFSRGKAEGNGTFYTLQRRVIIGQWSQNHLVKQLL